MFRSERRERENCEAEGAFVCDVGGLDVLGMRGLRQQQPAHKEVLLCVSFSLLNPLYLPSYQSKGYSAREHATQSLFSCMQPAARATKQATRALGLQQTKRAQGAAV